MGRHSSRSKYIEKSSEKPNTKADKGLPLEKWRNILKTNELNA